MSLYDAGWSTSIYDCKHKETIMTEKYRITVNALGNFVVGKSPFGDGGFIVSFHWMGCESDSIYNVHFTREDLRKLLNDREGRHEDGLGR